MKAVPIHAPRRRCGLPDKTAWASVALAALLCAGRPAWAQDDDLADGPILTVDDAIASAYVSNHLLSATRREVAQAGEREAALQTRRLPALKLDAFGGRTLNSTDLTIPAGALGVVPGAGSLPPSDRTLTTSADFFGAGMASVGQPITQQYKIGLGIESVRIDRDLAVESVRREKQKLAAEVRTAYYQISATQVAIVALKDLVRAIEELDSISGRYVTEGVALRAEALEVKARLGRERQRLQAEESKLATQREYLNQLIGRDIHTPFRVAEASELIARAAGLSLENARSLATGRRPEVRTQSLRAAQADTARRQANAGWIPDLTLTASYARIANAGVAPDQVSAVGLYLSWEPFDWGRKSHEAKEHALQNEQAREGKREAEEEINVEVGQRWRNLKDTAALLEATKLSEQAAMAYLDNTRNRYREDASVLHDVLEAESRLSRARHDFTDALAGYWSAAASLQRAIGDED